jgi:phenylacetate-coenzyme A ligase PaaK-like adenylate-forming protein
MLQKGEKPMNEHASWLQHDIHRVRKQGIASIMQRQRARLNEMVAFARMHSPYYRELYQDLPDNIEDPGMLPITNKKALLARFDDWCTDQDVTLEQVQAFVNNPDLIGEPYLGKYLVATTSGTTGTRGIFLVDERYNRLILSSHLKLCVDGSILVICSDSSLEKDIWLFWLQREDIFSHVLDIRI